MADATPPCPACGTATTPGIKFCGQCGLDLAALASAPAATAPSPEPAASAPKPAAEMKRTVMGMPAMDLAALQEEARTTIPDGPPAEALAHAPVGALASKMGPKHRTMLGMMVSPLAPEGATPAAAPAQAAAPLPAAAASTAAPTHRTMLGMPASALGAGVAPDASAPGAPAFGARSAPVASLDPATNRTMLGMPAKSAAAAQAEVAVEPQPTSPSGHPPRQRTAVAYGDAADLPSMPSGIPGQRKTGLYIGLALVALLVFGVLGAGVVWLATRGGPDIRADTAQDGEVLLIEVPGAPDGSRVRYAGQEMPLAAGQARFPLAANILQVGDNEIVVDVITPDGATEQQSVVLSLDYRVRPDLTGLEADPPVLAIVVNALPGSTVMVDDEPLLIDATGHGRKEVPLGTGHEGPALERTFRYRVVLPAEGGARDGQVQVRVPYTTMQIDRPGESVVTDSEAIEVAGQVHPEARVTVDGALVPVNEGRFLHRLPLPAVGERTVVVLARQPGKAPRRRELQIRRVADLAAEASGYEVDRSITYARLGADPNTYRGRHVAFEGRVYNVQVAAGRSELQILVRGCPRGQRCPLWVTYPSATEAELHSFVRVLGEVAGEQQFRSRSGEVITVPKVDATYVLPAAR